MSYRDLDAEHSSDTERVADAVRAPDPTEVEHPPPADSAPSPARRNRLALVALVVAALGLGMFRVAQALGDDETVAPTVTVTRTQAAAPGTQQSPPATPGARSTQTPTPSPPSQTFEPAPPGNAPEPTAAADNGAAALAATNRFIPAWSAAGPEAARRAAMTPVATQRLVEQLAPLDADALPTVTGKATVRDATPSLVLVELPTDQGTALLTVQPASGRWVVTALSLEKGDGAPA